MIDLASTTYILICTAFVQLMTPGLAFFYGGLMSDQSVITMMMQSFASMGVVSILWYFVIFSFCFGETLGYFGNPGTFGGMWNVSTNQPLMRNGVEFVGDIPGLLFVVYQGMFAVFTPSLMTGAFADRFRFKPYLLFISLWLLFVYAPWCHWLWGGGWASQFGARDFAGGLVVHVTAGFSALASLVLVGKRTPEEQDTADKPHNVPFVALGTALLWFGWFGFNGGSALATRNTAIAATVNTQISASVALFLWMVIDWIRHGRPGLVGLCIGALAGLATVTPAAGFIQPWGALALGIMATLCCYTCCELRKRLGLLDDALDVWAIHGVGGFVGTVMVGALADPEKDCGNKATALLYCVNPGTVHRSGLQFGKQLGVTVCCATYSVVVTLILLKTIDFFIPLKPLTRGDNKDLSEHGEVAYKHTPPKQHMVDRTPEVAI